MVWFIFAALTALFESLKDVFGKKSLREIDEYTVAWSLWFFTFICLTPVLFFKGLPQLGPKFWIAFFLGGSLNTIAAILYMRAIKSSDLSSTIPMITFSPLFLLILSPLILGESAKLFGIIGVILIVIGSYVLNLRGRVSGVLGPIKALFTEKGPRLMLIVAFIWSITSIFDKIGVQNSSPLLWSIGTGLFLSISIFPLALFKSRRKLLSNLKALFPVGIFNALSMIFQMIAINLTLVAYVISIKRVSAVLGVIFGCLIFKEKGLKEKLIGVIIMVIGVLLITLL